MLWQKIFAGPTHILSLKQPQDNNIKSSSLPNLNKRFLTYLQCKFTSKDNARIAFSCPGERNYRVVSSKAFICFRFIQPIHRLILQ